MGRVSRHLTSIAVLLVLISSGNAFDRPEDGHIYGHLERHVRRDTLIVSYDLVIRGGANLVILTPLFLCSAAPDGSAPSQKPAITIYAADTIPEPSSPGASPKDLHLKGEASVPFPAYCRLRGCSVDASGGPRSSRWYSNQWVEFSPIGTLSLSIIPPIGGAWYKTTLDSSTTKKGLAFGIEFNAIFDIGHFRFEPYYQLTVGDDFTAKEAVPMSVRYYLGNRTDFLPSIYVAPKYSTLHVIKDRIDFEDKEWGVETGLAIQGPFEQLSYSYCTGLGGYHKASLYLAVFRMGSWTGGTRYEYYHYDNTEMFRVMGVIQGFPTGGGTGVGHGATDLSYLNNRPIPHKVLAYAGMAPLVVAMVLLSAFPAL